MSNYKNIDTISYNGVIPIMFLRQDKNKRQVWAFKCPNCCNFFSARLDSVKSGHTRSCGCLRRETTRKTGLANRGTNIIQSSKFGYLRVFYRVQNHYSIVDNTSETIERLKQGCISRQMRYKSDKADPICTIDGNYTKLSRLIANTPDGLEADHINHEPEDCRTVNVRNGTQLQNKANTPLGVGKIIKLKNKKFGIQFPDELNVDTSSLIFNTKEKANKKRREIEAEKFGDWTYEKSQELSKEFATCEFTVDPYVDSWANTGTLGEIMQLPPDNVLNARVRDLKEAVKRGDIYPDEEWRLQHDLMYDYHHANT